MNETNSKERQTEAPEGESARKLLIQANWELEYGKFKAAEKHFREIVDPDPENGEARFGLFLARQRVKSEEELLQDITLEKIVAIYNDEVYRLAVDNAAGNFKARIEAFDDKLLARKEEFERISWSSQHDSSVDDYDKDKFEIKKAAGKWHLTACRGFKMHIRIPRGVEIVDRCIDALSSVRIIEIPASVTAIADGAFQDCKSLVEVKFDMGAKLKHIGNSAFSGCSNLTTCSIPDKVKSIGRNAFNGCKSLRNIKIPDSVASIGEYAFTGCKFD